MEASGFYQMASRLGTSELIHCLKIVSDNLQQPSHTVNANNVKSIIATKIDNIDSIVNLLIPIAEELESITVLPDNYEMFIEKWHFTKSQRMQLQKLLRQWILRLPGKESYNTVNKLKTAKEVLQSLRDNLNNTTFNIYQ